MSLKTVGGVLMVLGMAFTGYTLPWDQKSYWGLTIMSHIVTTIPVIGMKLRYLVLGGTEVGQNTLSRAFVMHTRLLPLLMGLIMAVHFWRIWKDDHLLSAGTGNGRAEPVEENGPPVRWRHRSAAPFFAPFRPRRRAQCLRIPPGRSPARSG